MIKSKLTKPNGKIIVVTHKANAPLDPKNEKMEVITALSENGTCFRIEENLATHLENADLENMVRADEVLRETYAKKSATHVTINEKGEMHILGLLDKRGLEDVLSPYISVEEMEWRCSD